MKIYETEILNEVATLPTELDLRKITTRRGLTVSWKDRAKLRNLEAGLAGEEIAIGYFKRMGERSLGSHSKFMDGLRYGIRN